MARRPKDDCPLCSLTPEQHAEAWYAYQDTSAKDWKAPAQVAENHGVSCDAADARNHFQYHRPVQPAPRGNLKRGSALVAARALPQRLQEIIRLVASVPALSGSQLAELFYWDGSEAKWDSARNACYRDLNRLMWGDFLYRFYPPVSATPSSQRRGRQENLSLYYLGREGIPLIEAVDHVEPKAGEWVSDAETLAGNVESVYADQDSAEIVVALARQSKRMQANNMLVSVENMAVRLHFNPGNWFGDRRAAVNFKEPFGVGYGRVQPAGLASIGIEVPGKNAAFQAPFFYEYFTGARPAEQVADKMLRYAEMRMSGALAQRFPDFAAAGSWIPVILFVCREPGHVAGLQAAVSKLVSKHELLRNNAAPVAIVTDEQTLGNYGLSGTCWASLWDTETDDHRHQLVKVLTQNSRVLFSSTDLDTRLGFDSTQATRQAPGGRRLDALPSV